MQEQEISLLDLWRLFRKYIGRIIGLTLIGAALAVLFMVLFVDKKYESEAQLIVNQRSGQEQALQYNEVQANLSLVNTYRDIVRGQAVLEAVNNRLGNIFTTEGLKSAISVEQSQNSQAFYISATMESPADAQNVVNTLIEEFEATLKGVYGEEISSIYVMSPGSYNENAVSPSVIIYGLIGGMLGFVLMLGIALIQELMDNRVKSVDDLTAMGLTRLGEVYGLTQDQVKKNRYRLQTSAPTTRRRV